MKTLLRTGITLLILFVLGLITEMIPPLRWLTEYLDLHPDPYRWITAALAAVGWVLMIGVLIYFLVSNSTSMREDQAHELIETSSEQSAGIQRFFGRVSARGFELQVSFREIKDAVRSGEWMHRGRWWAILVGILALIFIAYGMFGFFFVIGPPLVKLLCAGALVYATARTIWGFWLA